MTEDEIIASLQADRLAGLSPEDQLAIPELDVTSPTGLAAPGAPAAPSPVPGDPARAFEAPTEGPPAPSPTDALMAQQPPAGAGIPTRDPLQDAVPGVPREAPGNVGAPAPLPGAPGYTPPAPEAASGSSGAVAQSLDEQKAARDAGLAANEKTAEGGQEYHDAQLDAAVQHRQNVDASIKHAEDIQARYDAADKAAADQVAQTQAALKNFKFKDYWSDKSAGQRVLSALAVALGGFGAGLTHTPNYALQILDKEMDEDHARQVEQLKQLTDQDVTAHTGITDVRAARTRALADLTMADAQKDRLIAGQLEEAAARSTDANYKNVVAANVAKKREEAAAKDVEAQKMLRTMNLEDQVKAAQIDEMKARAEQARAHAAGTGGFAKKPKGGGSGGGGVSSHAETLLTQKIEEFQGQNGGKMPSQGQIYSWADSPEIKLPHEAKAGHPSVANVLAHAGRMQTTDAAGQRADLQGDRFLEAQVKNFASEHQLPKLEAASRKLDEVRSMLDDGNPVSAMSALMEYDAAAKGSSATESSMHAMQSHMGGSWARLKGMIENKQTGGFGDEQTKILRGAIDAGRKAFKESIEPIHEAFGGKFDYSKPGVAQAAAGLFGPLGYRGKTMPKASGGASPELVAKARAAVNDPARTPAVRSAAQKIIDQAGASGG